MVLIEDLSSREHLILEALVRAYVDLGAPVASSTLLKREGFGFSPATIRKTLGDLEEKGFIAQPHTSAGRTPTNKGYRAYAEEALADWRVLTLEDAEHLRHQFEVTRRGRVDEIHSQLARIICDISSQLGLVLAPRFERAVFDGLELVRLSERRLLLVATINLGPVRSLVIEVGSDVSQRDIDKVGQLLNERLSGLTLAEVRGTVKDRVSSDIGNPQLLRVVAEEIESLANSSSDDLHVAGVRHMFLQPELRDSDHAAGLMDFVESRDGLASLLSGREGVVVTIGEENEAEEMRQCSMVTASYDVSGAIGVVGVLGPTRMPYKRLVALVNYAAMQAAEFVSLMSGRSPEDSTPGRLEPRSGRGTGERWKDGY